MSYPTYDQTPFVAGDPSPLRALLAQADGRVVRIGVIGDSKWTAPAGFGPPCHAWLSILLNASRGGYFPETPASAPMDAYYDLHVTTGQAQGGVAPLHETRLPADQIPPGMHPRRLGQIWNGGLLRGVQVDDSQLGYPWKGGTYFDVSAGFAVDVVASTYPASCDVWCYDSSSTDGTTQYAGYPGVNNGRVENMGIGLDATAGTIKTATTTFPYTSDHPHPAAVVFGTLAPGDDLDTKNVDVVSLVIRSLARPRGVVICPFGVGGIQTTDLIANHANCWPILRALRIEALILACGTNDAYNGRSAADVYATLAAAVAAIRAGMGAAAFPVAMVAETFDARQSSPQRAQYDQYAGAMAALAAASGPGVCALNVRRLTDLSGWRSSDGERTLTDNPSTGALFWTPGTSYLAAGPNGGDVVYFERPSGMNWLCVADHTAAIGNSPPDAAHWRATSRHSYDKVHDSYIGAAARARAYAALMTGIPAPDPVAAVQSGLTAQGYSTGRAPLLDRLDATVSSRQQTGQPATLPPSAPSGYGTTISGSLQIRGDEVEIR